MPKIDSVKQKIISNYLNSHQGRLKLASSMINPIRRNLNYASLGRQIFSVQQITLTGTFDFNYVSAKPMQKVQIFIWKMFYKLFPSYVYHSISKSYWKILHKHSRPAVGLRPKTTFISVSFVHCSSGPLDDCTFDSSYLEKSSMKEIETSMVVDG
jgi:hypothetical protein